jgi:hypothetical protein
MHSPRHEMKGQRWIEVRSARRAVLILVLCLAGGAVALATPLPQAQGEVIGTIEGQAIAVKGPMSVQVVGNEVKTLLRSGADVRVKMGRARIDLAEGGTIAVCGPAHISMLKAGNALTVAVDSGTIHAHVEGNLTLNVFTAQILAKTVAIGDGPQDVLVGFDTPGLLCARAGRGALRLEEQFGGQSVMVPQGGDVVVANGQLQGLRSNSGLCACESFDRGPTSANRLGPEISTLASSDEVKRNSTPRKPSTRVMADPKAPDLPKVPAVEPTYQVFMPPLRYDASAKIQDEPDPRLIVLVRRVHVRPTLIFQSRVEGDPLPQTTASALNAAASKPEQAAAKNAQPTNSSVVDRVKSFFRSLWTPSS